jgi:hypothetical protein
VTGVQTCALPIYVSSVHIGPYGGYAAIAKAKQYGGYIYCQQLRYSN